MGRVELDSITHSIEIHLPESTHRACRRASSLSSDSVQFRCADTATVDTANIVMATDITELDMVTSEKIEGVT